MLRKVNGKWALVSKKTLRPLAYYKGEGKPSDEWVSKQERRVQAFKHGFEESLDETVSPDILPKSGAGAWGTDELTNTYKNDTPGQTPEKKKKVISFKDYVK